MTGNIRHNTKANISQSTKLKHRSISPGQPVDLKCGPPTTDVIASVSFSFDYPSWLHRPPEGWDPTKLRAWYLTPRAKVPCIITAVTLIPLSTYPDAAEVDITGCVRSGSTWQHRLSQATRHARGRYKALMAGGPKLRAAGGAVWHWAGVVGTQAGCVAHS